METLTKTVNGFDQNAIAGIVNAIQSDPGIARFELRAQNEWIDGGHTRSYIQGFYGAGQEDTSRTKPFVYDSDEPPVLLGSNKGANPAEVVLYGLLGCMTTAMVLLAAARGIAIEGVRSSIEGDIDLRAFLGLDPDGIKGFSQIRVTFDIKGADPEQKEELLMLAKQSPVLHTLLNPVDVQVALKQDA